MTYFLPLHLTVGAFLGLELVAAASLALWAVVRFPNVAPTTFRTSAVIGGVAMVVVRLLPLVESPLVRLPGGGYLALFGCVLPAFFAVFVSAAWVMKLLAAALPRAH